jgi:hypothetical protein
MEICRNKKEKTSVISRKIVVGPENTGEREKKSF